MGNSLLRSFLSVHFAQQTLTMCAGQNEQTRQLMQLVVKALFLHEMLLRQIPMDKRSYGAIEAADWELFAEHISTALERYLAQISKSLGKLHEESVPQELQLEGVTFTTAACIVTSSDFLLRPARRGRLRLRQISLASSRGF